MIPIVYILMVCLQKERGGMKCAAAAAAVAAAAAHTRATK
jgi:hypothetical protein